MAQQRKTSKQKTQEAPAEEEPAAEREASPLSSAAQRSGSPGYARPLRIETFSAGGKWGYRLCDANGGVLRESPVDYDTRDAAADAAEQEDFGEPVVHATRNTPGAHGRNRKPLRR